MLNSDHTTCRSTQTRLLKAMGISSCLVALILAALGLLFEVEMSDSRRTADPGTVLIVQTEIRSAGQNSEELDPENSDSQSPAEQNESEETAPGIRASEDSISYDDVEETELNQAVVESSSPNDWHSIARTTARKSISEYYDQNEMRSAMWQQSHSVMFQPVDEYLNLEETPVLANVKFKLRSRVLGLGLNIGSCFIGIPIAGVDVEARSFGPTIFICGQGS